MAKGFAWDDFPEEKEASGGFDWDAHPEVTEEKGLITQGLEKWDSWTGAPARAAIGAAQDGNNPLTAAWDQFNTDPSKAPTGKQLVMKAGVPDIPLKTTIMGKEIGVADMLPMSNLMPDAIKSKANDALTPANVAGVALDAAADPTNLIPVGLAAKGGQKALNLAGDGARAFGRSLGAFAEKAAVNATGATGAQAANFADDAGRQLLNRGLVKFGDNAGNIADRVGAARDAANKQIDTALKALDASGVKVDANTVYAVIRDKINKLKADPSQADTVKQLEAELDNLLASTDAKGIDTFGMQEAENIKRGYNRKAGNWQDPEKSRVGKEMYRTYAGAVEDTAQAADPATAALFKEGKQTHRLLAPIQEASERRAMAAAQAQPANLMDTATMVAGEMAAPGAGIGSSILRRVAGPRVSSSLAVTADKISKLMLKSPRFQMLAQTNPQAFNAMVLNLARRSAEGGGAGALSAAQNGQGQMDSASTPLPDGEAQRMFLDGN